MGPYYTTKGSVCGACGHNHRTAETARKCLQRHQRCCERQGGYSDRYVWFCPDPSMWWALERVYGEEQF